MAVLVWRAARKRLGGPQQFQPGGDTDQSFRQEQQRAEQNEAVDQFAIFLHAAQRLGQRRERYSADDRAGDRTQPADDDEGDVLDRRQDAELRRIDEADDARQATRRQNRQRQH